MNFKDRIRNNASLCKLGISKDKYMSATRIKQGLEAIGFVYKDSENYNNYPFIITQDRYIKKDVMISIEYENSNLIKNNKQIITSLTVEDTFCDVISLYCMQYTGFRHVKKTADDIIKMLKGFEAEALKLIKKNKECKNEF